MASISITHISSADIYVVVAKNSDTETLKKKDVIAIYTGKTKALPNGNLAAPFDHKDTAKIKAEFYKKLTNRSISQINSYWARLIFSGRHVPPTQLNNEAAVMSGVAQNPNAIGYVSNPDLDIVKVVYTIK